MTTRVILNIPHRSLANAWIAWDDNELMDIASETGFDEDHYGELTVETAKQFLSDDNHNTYIFSDEHMLNDMSEFVQTYAGHQAGQAIFEIQKMLLLFSSKYAKA